MKAKIAVILSILLLLAACTVKNPSLPVWDIDLKIPLVNDLYYASDLVDSVNIIIQEHEDYGEMLYLTSSGEVETPMVGNIDLQPAIDAHFPLLSGITISQGLPFADTQNNANLSYGKVATGSLRYRFVDIVAQTQEIEITVAEIKDPAGDPLRIVYEGQVGWQEINLAAYTFGTLNATDPLDELTCGLTTTSSLPGYSPLGTMDLQMVETLSFSMFQGKIQTLELSLDSSAAQIDIEYPYGLNQAVTANGAKLQIDLFNRMGFSCEFRGFLEARVDSFTPPTRIAIQDDQGQNFIINPATGNEPGYTRVTLEEGISDLIQQMPEHVEIVDAVVKIGTASGYGSIRNTDYLNADYVVDLPFRFMLHDYPILMREVQQIDISADNRDNISKNLQNAELDMDIMNKIPVGLCARAYFGHTAEIDPQNPDSYVFYKEVHIDSAETNDQWQKIEGLALNKAELDLFTNETVYLRWEFRFAESQDWVNITAGSGDYIAIKSMLLGKLRIEESGK
ncbi:MAG: hypothetical protein PHO85_06255 [Candidatus Cloacimonetes bacterium]|nr:hypothetical protein [Candidatus Cloacimonadota bacterium]MDD4148102.1 hypothetical protein [Candidatus Cloacimonadota bacterium]MDD4559142.1 hypothetical protein [Candidatus Cloacimonadota bacterium]